MLIKRLFSWTPMFVVLVVFFVITVSQIKSVCYVLFLGKVLPPSTGSSVDLDLDNDEWKIIWHDEFNTLNPIQANWNVEGNILQQKGCLQLIDKHLFITSPDKNRIGIIESHGKFSLLYGKIEVRARLPKDCGLKPVIWLIFEENRNRPKIDLLKPATSANGKFSEDFHKFFIEWDPNKIVWSIDGEEMYRLEESVPDTPLFLFVSALSDETTATNICNSDSDLPTFEIDYIRIYKKEII